MNFARATLLINTLFTSPNAANLFFTQGRKEREREKNLGFVYTNVSVAFERRNVGCFVFIAFSSFSISFVIFPFLSVSFLFKHSYFPLEYLHFCVEEILLKIIYRSFCNWITIYIVILSLSTYPWKYFISHIHIWELEL